MYVKKYMKENPMTVGPDTGIGEAGNILRANPFRHLPVVDSDGLLLGMITDRDIRSAYPSSVLDRQECEREQDKINVTPVSQIMSQDVVSLGGFSTLDDALLLLGRERVGALPVLDEHRKVTGIFSVRDLLSAYNELFGVGEKGSALITVRSDGKPRPLSRITHVLEDHDIHFSRVVRKKMADHEESGHEMIYIRVNTFNIHAVHSALAEAGFPVQQPC